MTDTGAKSWLFMYKSAGRRREMGLGSARDVSLSKARELAAEARLHRVAGRDPLSVRAKPGAMSFGRDRRGASREHVAVVAQRQAPGTMVHDPAGL